MARYIDVDKAMPLIDEFGKRYCMTVCNILNCKEIIAKIPTADVQEVVRCKDCKYSCEEKPVFGITDYSCIKLGIHCLDANDFCSYGAKMDEEEQK